MQKPLYILKANVISALLTHPLCEATIKKLFETTSRLNVQPGNVLKRFSRRRFPCYIKTNSERKFYRACITLEGESYQRKEKFTLRTEAMLIITDLKKVHDTVQLAFFLI